MTDAKEVVERLAKVSCRALWEGLSPCIGVCPTCENSIKVALTELSAMGLVVVPREPSGEMLKAGWDIAGEIECGDLFAVWTAMLTAATKKEKSYV